MPTSLSSSPLKTDLDYVHFPDGFKEEQLNRLQVPSSEEVSEDDDEEEEQSGVLEYRETRFDSTIPIVPSSLGEQTSKGVFMRSRSNTLDEIQEESSSELEDYDYGNESVSDSASYDVAVHHKKG